jgi:hypothetical protein
MKISKGDLVKVKICASSGVITKKGVVIGDKIETENVMFPCVSVYIFDLNECQRCFPHQIEVLSSTK